MAKAIYTEVPRRDTPASLVGIYYAACIPDTLARWRPFVRSHSRFFSFFFSVRVASARGDDLIFADLHNAASATPHERETSHYSAILGEVGPLSRSVTIHTCALMLMLLWKSVRDGFNADNKKQSKRVLLSRLKYTVRQGCDPSFYNVTNKYIPFFMRCY